MSRWGNGPEAEPADDEHHRIRHAHDAGQDHQSGDGHEEPDEHDLGVLHALTVASACAPQTAGDRPATGS